MGNSEGRQSLTDAEGRDYRLAASKWQGGIAQRSAAN
jgi:hypothetical protein